jgi:hypothetical protein
MKLEELPFDRIHVDEAELSVDEFLAMPLHERVRHIIGGSLDFTKQGYLVDRQQALTALRIYATAPL